ncbi:MAG: hypothetical protein FWG89_05330 [Treponema sp.]|nr:hypothetical protein [Treponema sp.]
MKKISRYLILVAVCYLLFANTACPVSEGGYPLMVNSPANVYMHRGQFRLFTITREGKAITDAVWSVSGASTPSSYTRIDNGFLFIAYDEYLSVLDVRADLQGQFVRITVHVLPSSAEIQIPGGDDIYPQGHYDLTPGTGTRISAESHGGFSLDWTWSVVGDPPGIVIYWDSSSWSWQLGLSANVQAGTSFIIRAEDADDSDIFAYATITAREPEITGVKIELNTGNSLIKGKENYFSAFREVSGPVPGWPSWEWDIVSPGSADLHPDTGFVIDFLVGEYLFIHEDETASTITVRATLFGTDLMEELTLSVTSPLITISSPGTLEVAKGSSISLTADIAAGVTYDSVDWMVQAGGWWGFPHEDTDIIPTSDPLTVELYVSPAEEQDVLIVQAYLYGVPGYDIFAPYAEVEVIILP